MANTTKLLIGLEAYHAALKRGSIVLREEFEILQRSYHILDCIIIPTYELHGENNNIITGILHKDEVSQ